MTALNDIVANDAEQNAVDSYADAYEAILDDHPELTEEERDQLLDQLLGLEPVSNLSAILNAGGDCGTGAGGFQPGNSCARSSGSSGKTKADLLTKPMKAVEKAQAAVVKAKEGLAKAQAVLKAAKADMAEIKAEIKGKVVNGETKSQVQAKAVAQQLKVKEHEYVAQARRVAASIKYGGDGTRIDKGNRLKMPDMEAELRGVIGKASPHQVAKAMGNGVRYKSKEAATKAIIGGIRDRAGAIIRAEL